MRAPVDDAELARLSNDASLSQQAISVRLGVSLPTIERALRRLGLKSVKGRGPRWNGIISGGVDSASSVRAMCCCAALNTRLAQKRGMCVNTGW
ncbi:hypothetical protein [Polaromonas sp. CG9_12]|nr:hypothetical protein [Polaromonas sp. CG9_12]